MACICRCSAEAWSAENPGGTGIGVPGEANPISCTLMNEMRNHGLESRLHRKGDPAPEVYLVVPQAMAIPAFCESE